MSVLLFLIRVVEKQCLLYRVLKRSPQTKLSACTIVSIQGVFPTTPHFIGSVDLITVFSLLDFSLIKYFSSTWYVSGLVHQGPNSPEMGIISSVAALCWSPGRNKPWENNGEGSDGHYGKPEVQHQRPPWGQGEEGCRRRCPSRGPHYPRAMKDVGVGRKVFWGKRNE